MQLTQFSALWAFFLGLSHKLTNMWGPTTVPAFFSMGVVLPNVRERGLSLWTHFAITGPSGSKAPPLLGRLLSSEASPEPILHTKGGFRRLYTI